MEYTAVSLIVPFFCIAFDVLEAVGSGLWALGTLSSEQRGAAISVNAGADWRLGGAQACQEPLPAGMQQVFSHF